MISDAVSNGNLSQSDADAAQRFLGDKHHMSVAQYVYAKQGHRPELENDEGF